MHHTYTQEAIGNLGLIIFSFTYRLCYRDELLVRMKCKPYFVVFILKRIYRGFTVDIFGHEKFVDVI